MFLVNFAGGFQATPDILRHHNTWCSFADTVMPQFFFAVGMALRLVMLRDAERHSPSAALEAGRAPWRSPHAPRAVLVSAAWSL